MTDESLPPGSLRECVAELESVAWRAGAARAMDMENGHRPVRGYAPVGDAEDSQLAAARERVERAIRVGEQALIDIFAELDAVRGERVAEGQGADDLHDLYAQRFAVFAFSIDGFEALDAESQQVCRDAATWTLREIARAQQADRATIATLTRERAAVEQENTQLRLELFLRHGCTGAALYGDDGEMQCKACRLDFKRQPVDELTSALLVLALEKAAAAGAFAAAPVTTPTDAMVERAAEALWVGLYPKSSWPPVYNVDEARFRTIARAALTAALGVGNLCLSAGLPDVCPECGKVEWQSASDLSDTYCGVCGYRVPRPGEGE